VLGAKSPSELDYICSGINHQTWFVDLKLNGRKIGKDELVAAFEAHPVFSQQEKLRIDVLKRFGVYSTESNGHLSEYLPWYRKRPDEITKWIDMSDWIHGETGGYLRHSTETRNWFETEFPQFLESASKPIDRAKRSNEHASHILEALETGRVYRGHFNLKNNGVITNLPADAIIESPGFVDRFGINMVSGITIPEACAATCIASINVQRMSVHAAISGDIDLLKLAVLHDPLVGAVATPEEVWQMVDEMVVAQATAMHGVVIAETVAPDGQIVDLLPRHAVDGPERRRQCLGIPDAVPVEHDGIRVQRRAIAEGDTFPKLQGPRLAVGGLERLRQLRQELLGRVVVAHQRVEDRLAVSEPGTTPTDRRIHGGRLVVHAERRDTSPVRLSRGRP